MRRKFVALATSTIRAGRVTRRARTLLLSAILAAIVTGGSAAAQSGKPSEQLRQACASDVRTLCAGITPGGGRIKQCMIEKSDQLSDGCKSAMQAARAMSGK